MTRTAKILLVVSAALPGAALGFAAGVKYQAGSTSKSISTGFALLSGRILVAEAGDLDRVYGSADRDVQVYALEHFAHTLELIKSDLSPLGGQDIGLLDLALTHARLGLLHRASGDTQKAEQSFKRAVEYFPARNGRQASEDEIVQYVLKLDRGLARNRDSSTTNATQK